ncbi:rhodanese-like domain-containing protein [Hymenobacter sp. BT683]|uniref:Rhodanese-like domain-containing protein n=1 Tax=Hymenobacter jeongseonensis TaxID=2791027 RepID=A0ABS0IGV4_9BACT|nr:rhodanese-like domain-containing protein [Hymenobacter jeongseonensis]MBF9237592.1 rhodanese-like domain-containing protein [Hymenobacter jeongseonensis]
MALKRAAFTCFSLFALTACGQTEPGKTSAPYARMLQALYRNTVPTIAPAELAKELSKPVKPQLLDARSPAEFKVSHLRGARFVNYDSLAKEQFVGLDRRQPVVVYCSVGYRSERLGERLQALGFKNVRNLYGGLFEWVNQNNPVYNAQGLTRDVHPYSALWSPWLKNGRKVYE